MTPASAGRNHLKANVSAVGSLGIRKNDPYTIGRMSVEVQGDVVGVAFVQALFFWQGWCEMIGRMCGSYFRLPEDG